ncbi:MAG: hypothetical protein CSA18_04900, partial [Deltaproteobacteria bacterium]
KAYRLKSAINPTLDNESYTYDKVGNRLTSASTAGNWSYDNSDQLLSTPADTYEYTANGNTKKITPSDTTQKPSEYIYDARDRLAEVKKDNVSLQKNRYDFQQRRIAKITTNGETYFLYGQTGLLAEYQSNGDFIQGYGYNPKDSYTTNPVYTLKQSGANYQADFYHNDHLATPQKLTNSTGAVSWAMESNAFGETTLKTQTTKNNLRFPGQYADSDIGLNQNYFRDYAPNLGRYAESDPIGMDGGINNYVYIGNRVSIYVDSYGLVFIPCEYTQTCPPDEKPDKTVCIYYQNIANSQGCIYHDSAYKICIGSDDWFSQAANFLLESCKRQEEKAKNCIRKCLVAEDKKARNKPECQLKKCNGGICTKRKCIDDYHYKCFEKCKVPKRCYGGEYDDYIPGAEDTYYDD